MLDHTFENYIKWPLVTALNSLFVGIIIAVMAVIGIVLSAAATFGIICCRKVRTKGTQYNIYIVYIMTLHHSML